MFICIDACYCGGRAVVAGVVFKDIQSDSSVREYLKVMEEVEPYRPGEFSKRELPGIMALLRDVEYNIHAVIIDGYVYLSPELNPGLGANVFRLLGEQVPVIGVAKSPYRDISMAVKVFRGDSNRPLFVTAAGMKTEKAASLIRLMHGRHRIPTLLKQVDTLSRRHSGPK